MDQPVPKVSAADVERIVRRDFPNHVDQALEILAGYGSDAGHNEPYRVRIAALKVANGNLNQLKQSVATANLDSRDLLVAAEYPNYFDHVPGPDAPPAERTRAIIEADWNQFQTWFSR